MYFFASCEPLSRIKAELEVHSFSSLNVLLIHVVNICKIDFAHSGFCNIEELSQ